MTAPYTSYINSLALTHPSAMITPKLVSEHTADQAAAQKFDWQTFNIHYLQLELISAEMRRLLSDRKPLRKLHLIAVVTGGFQFLGGLSEIWALTKLPFTSLISRHSGTIGRDSTIRLEAVEGPKLCFVGGKSTVGDFLEDAAMKPQNKGFVIGVEKDFIIEVSSEEIPSEEETGSTAPESPKI
ncbi:hypothetical protein BPAE_0028g00200 [Botrytis paeoniae]|uniref:Uncharacterized protein n=1 Tax=Botrytis paeoniae TaxID=278948 RepID=A0A4Z1G243_9HELO|nr:hypothetical protein BPAE_0028g00200 [Botrytis paeoniae]